VTKRALLCISISLGACASETPVPDAAVPDATVDTSGGKAPIKVAAIQYAEGDYTAVASCKDNVCALRHYIEEAAKAGAKLVVTPEYVLGQKSAEPLPEVGSNPGTDSALAESAPLKLVSQDARRLQIYIVFDLITSPGTAAADPLYNSAVALGPDGRVVALHHKFNLFGDEDGVITPGSDVTVFSSPLGNVGLLVCADIYAETKNGAGQLCSPCSPLPRKLSEVLKARVVAIPAHWMAADPTTLFWYYAQRYKVFGVFANTTRPFAGGGVWDPDGAVLAMTSEAKPSIIYADIPAPE
jgi:predicted amidohydrolase